MMRLLVCASALLAACGGRAQPAASPFLPPPGGHAAMATADAPLEFRGVAELPEGPSFRVVDPARKTGVWVRLNERDPDLGVIVKQHDAARDTVTVEQQGRTFTLALHRAKVSASGAPMPPAFIPPPMAQPPAPMAVPAVLGTPPPAGGTQLQQAQLDAVAAAVAQRRALRDQAAQQLQQGAPPASPKANAAGQPGQRNRTQQPPP